MAEDARLAIAALFRMRGSPTMRESEFVLDASMKLRWYPPKDAQKLLQNALDLGLLQAEGGNVSPTFDVQSVSVPVNFRPGKEALRPPPKRDPFAELVERIRTATGEDTKGVVARINRAQERLGVDVEVAAAHIARASGLDVSKDLGRIETRILAKGR